MLIHNLNNVDSKQITNSNAANKVTDQEYDLDIDMKYSPQEGGPVLHGQGSGHFWCHITQGCNMTASCVDCFK